MDLAGIALIVGGVAALFAFLTGTAFLRKGEARRAHALMWGSIAVLIVLGMVIRHDWAAFLLFASFILVGQAATEMWRLRRERARADSMRR